MKTYAAVKSTSLKWAPQIPSNWQVKKSGYLINANKGENAASLTKEYCETNKGEYPVYSGQTSNNGIMGKIDTYEYDFPEVGVLFSTTVGAKAMTVSHLVGKFSLSQNCLIFYSVSNKLETRFAYYSFSTAFAFERALIPSHMQASFRMEDLYQYRIPLPPVAEQQKIAQFLDYETAKIDALINEQKRLIELLKEKRQAVISHAVTKGLNPEAPMKDSGVEWLGQIPEHWKTTPIKHVTKTFEQGWSPQCFNEPVSNDSELGVLKVGCVKQGRFEYSENKRLPPELKFKSELAVRAGDLLISRANTRELVGSAGVPTVNHDNLMISDKLFRLRLTGQALSRFVCFFLTTKAARQQIELAATGASDSMLNIGQGTIREMPFPCPPVEEQRQIVDYVVRVNWRLLELAGEALKLVNTLKERRSALISAAVTGKIDVRDWQPPAGSDTVDSNAAVQTERHYG